MFKAGGKGRTDSVSTQGLETCDYVIAVLMDGNGRNEEEGLAFLGVGKRVKILDLERFVK